MICVNVNYLLPYRKPYLLYLNGIESGTVLIYGDADDET
jgi:hypothetical protein